MTKYHWGFTLPSNIYMITVESKLLSKFYNITCRVFLVLQAVSTLSFTRHVLELL